MLSLVIGIKGIFLNTLSKYALESECKQTELQFNTLAGCAEGWSSSGVAVGPNGKHLNPTDLSYPR